MSKVVLLSQFPMPYQKIGSWTTMYKNYLEANHQIDYIVCEKPQEQFKGVVYSIVRNDFFTKIRRKIYNFYSVGYVDSLFKILESNDEKFIIQVIDNYKIIFKINELLLKKGLRDRCYIQFFYHGFAPYLTTNKICNFHEIIDELVLLTHASYKAHINYYSIFPCKVSILHNGINTLKFHNIPLVERLKLKGLYGYQNKKVFVWCSQDRPKKGLNMILDVWKRVYAQNKDIHLLVIGAPRSNTIEGVTFLGKIPNKDLPKYYQMADCYLFPTLWHEGFGLSLVEALNCGCYCIASKVGGVPEVLQNGKYGKLIENPNFVSEWEVAINDYISGKESPIIIENGVYSIEDWILNMNQIIQKAKVTLL